MKEYFMSYVIKQKNVNGGFLDTGYGSLTIKSPESESPTESYGYGMEMSAKRSGVNERDIHVIQFNRI